MYITSFLRRCQNILTPVSASGKDKPWYISLLWIVRTEEAFRYSSAWDTLPSTKAEGVSWCMALATHCSMGSACSWQPQFSNCVIYLKLHHFFSGFTDSSFGPAKTDFWGEDLLQHWTKPKLGKPLLDCKEAHLSAVFYFLCNFLELLKQFQSWFTRISFLWSREQIVCCVIFPQKVLTISWSIIIGVTVLTVLRLLNSLVVIPFQQLHGCA